MLLAGCRSGTDLQGPRATTAQIPLWSMPYGCNGGLEIRTDEISVTGSGSWSETDYTSSTLDLSNGRLLRESQNPVNPVRAPKDTVTDMSDGTLRPLRESSVQSLTPSGFDAVVVTAKFIFAKETYFGSYDFPHLIRYGRVIIVDRPSRSVVWEANGKGITIQASPTQIIVCDANSTTAFAPEAARPQEVTDFYSAIRRGDTQKVMRLLPAWKRTPFYDLDGATPLIAALKEGKTAVARQLMAEGFSSDTQEANGDSPLCIALYHKEHHDLAILLLQSGADANYCDNDRSPPLSQAVESGSQQLISLLLQKGAKINARSGWDNNTALHEAVIYRNYDAIEVLLKGGADRAIKNNHGETAFDTGSTDECIQHMFTDGRVSTLPPACNAKPPRGEAVGFSPMQLIH
jgi:hypothetical protein